MLDLEQDDGSTEKLMNDTQQLFNEDPQKAMAMANQIVSKMSPEQQAAVVPAANSLVASADPAAARAAPATQPDASQAMPPGRDYAADRRSLADKLSQQNSEMDSEYKLKLGEADKEASNAKWKDALMYLVNGLGAASSDLLGYKEAAAAQRARQGQDEYGPQSKKQREDLMAWLKEKRGMNNSAYIQGIKGIDDDQKYYLEGKKADLNAENIRNMMMNRDKTTGATVQNADTNAGRAEAAALSAAEALAQRKKEHSDKMGSSKAKIAAGKKSRDSAVASQSIPFRSGRFVPVGEPVSKEVFRKVVDKVSDQAEALSGLEDLEKAAIAVINDPVDINGTKRADFQSAQELAMKLISVATGQGAMSGDERRTAINNVGDVSSSRFWLDQFRGLQSTNKDEYSKALHAIRQSAKFFDGLARARAKTAGLKFVEDAPAASSPNMSVAHPAPSGAKTFKAKDSKGNWSIFHIEESKIPAFLKAKPEAEEQPNG